VSLAYSPDGQTIAVGGENGGLRLWDVPTRSCRATLLGHNDRIWSVAFSPDGRTLATTSRDGTIRLWNVTGANAPGRTEFYGLKRDQDLGKIPASLAFLDRGMRILVANRAGDVLECDVRSRTSRVIRDAGTAPQLVWPYLDPGGANLAVGYSEQPGNPVSGTIAIHSLAGSRQPVILGRELDTASLSWSRDGRRVAVREHAGYLSIWELDGSLVARADLGSGSGSSPPQFLPTGNTIIAVCGELPSARPFQTVAWDFVRSRIERWPTEPGQPGAHTGKMCIAPDGQAFACIADSGAVVRDMSSLQVRFDLIGHDDQVTDLAYSPDGRTVATLSYDRTVRLWCARNGQQLLVLDGHDGSAWGVAFSPDGRTLASHGSGSNHGTKLLVWRAQAD
jgi:WD40 repeat protein